MKRVVFVLSLVLLLTSCGGSGGNGELVGVYRKGRWYDPEPYGMVKIPRGSYTLGSNDQEANWSMNSQSKTVSVESFWMDETEITNSEYRQFINYVRDSLARVRLGDPEIGGQEEDFMITEDRKGNELEPYLNWRKRIPWNSKEEGDSTALNYLFYQGNEKLSKAPEINARVLNYTYSWVDWRQAAKAGNRFDPLKGDYIRGQEGSGVLKDTTIRKDNGETVNTTVFTEVKNRSSFIMTKTINVYPDTLVWIRDFTYGYNDPYTKMYFWHPGYSEYPVVGVSWEQATAFCNWRTEYHNDYLQSKGYPSVHPYRLPTEAEWEYAARGGRDLALYPWGGMYLRTATGCFLANFKPMRGNYSDDGYMITAEVAQYPPNDYGLYDMAGNVAEWTSSAFAESANSFISDLNPDYQYNAKAQDPRIMKRKVVRGGSWKDIGYFLQVGTKTYEYQDEARSYIGFRCVRTYIGVQ